MLPALLAFWDGNPPATASDWADNGELWCFFVVSQTICWTNRWPVGDFRCHDAHVTSLYFMSQIPDHQCNTLYFLHCWSKEILMKVIRVFWTALWLGLINFHLGSGQVVYFNENTQTTTCFALEPNHYLKLCSLIRVIRSLMKLAPRDQALLSQNYTWMCHLEKGSPFRSGFHVLSVQGPISI